MKKIIILITFFTSTSGFSATFNFPECIAWFKSSTNLSEVASHFLCMRGDPLSVAQCADAVIKSGLQFSTYGVIFLCDRGDITRVTCAKSIDNFPADYITRVCNQEKEASIKAWTKW